MLPLGEYNGVSLSQCDCDAMRHPSQIYGVGKKYTQEESFTPTLQFSTINDLILSYGVTP